MPERARRIDLRFGDIAISAEGFDDPVAPVKQVLRFVQRLVEETPEMVGAALALDDADIERLVGEVAERMRIPRDGIEAVPGLILSLRAEPAAVERGDGIADATGTAGAGETVAAAALAAGAATGATLAASGAADPAFADASGDGADERADHGAADAPAAEDPDAGRADGAGAGAGPDFGDDEDLHGAADAAEDAAGDDGVAEAAFADDAEAVAGATDDGAAEADGPWSALPVGDAEAGADTDTATDADADAGETLFDAPASDSADMATDMASGMSTETAPSDAQPMGARPFAFLRGNPAAEPIMTDAARDETPAPEETDVDGPGYAVDAPSGDDWADASDAEHEDAVESTAGPAEEHDLPFEDAGPNEARLSGAEPDGSAGDPNFAPRAAAPWESETDAVSSGADAIPAGGAHDGYEDYEDGDPAHPFGTNAPETDPAPATASVSDASASSDWRLAPFATPQAAPEDATEDATEDASASVGFDRDASDDAPPETIFGAPDGAAGPALAPAAPDSTATLFGDSDLSPGAPVNIFGDPDASDGAGDLEPRDGPEDPEDATGPAGEPEEATIIGRPVRATVLPPEDTDDASDPAGEPEEINIFGGPARAAVLPSEEADDADDAPELARETEETTIFGASARATVLPPEDADDAPGPAEEPEEINIFGGPAPEPAAEQPQARDELRRRLFGGPSAAAPGPRWIEDPNEPAPLARPTSDRLGSVMSRYRGETGQGDEPAADADDGPVTAVWHPAEGPAIEPGTLAERANAVTVPDLLTVAAAWLTLVDRRSTFGRREVMEVFDQMPGDHPRTLEARIKGYGKLVRNGSLVLVDDGRFALSQEERDRFRPLIG